MPPEEDIDEALTNFRNSGNLLQSMLNVRMTLSIGDANLFISKYLKWTSSLIGL